MCNMTTIGLRELRQNASHWVARAASGETIEITNRGRPVAQLTGKRPGSVFERLVASGEITTPAATESIADIEPLEPWEGASPSEVLEDLRTSEDH